MQVVNGIYLPKGDTHFEEEIKRNPLIDGQGTYQWGKLSAALEVAPNRRGLALDIGAHVGLWTRILAREFQRVIAVEPTEEHVECLRKNIQPHEHKVSIWPFPLADEPRAIRLKLGQFVATAHVCVEGEREDFSFHAGTIDQYELKNLDFLKLDCEGFEYFVLKGGEETIRRWKPVIVVEQKKKRIQRYGLDRNQPAVRLLESWGAKEYWAKSGDHCLGWEKGE